MKNRVTISLTTAILFHIVGLLSLGGYCYLDKKFDKEMSQISNINDSRDETTESPISINIPTLKLLGWSFIFYNIFIFFTFSTIMPFNTNLNLLLQTRFNLS